MGRGLLAAPGNFDVSAKRSGSALVVSPKGEIDLATVDLVREVVEREQQPGEDVVDTSGLRYVLELHERAERDGYDIHIVRGPRAVQRVFEVSGLESRLPFVDDPSQAPG